MNIFKALGHLGVAMDAAEVLVTSSLDVARTDYAFAYYGTCFARFGLRYVLERHGRYLALYVDAV